MNHARKETVLIISLMGSFRIEYDNLTRSQAKVEVWPNR